jgi:hypothetical protein
MPPHPTFFVRKHVYERYGTFNEGLKTAADYELMLRLLYKHGCTCAYIPRFFYKNALRRCQQPESESQAAGKQTRPTGVGDQWSYRPILYAISEATPQDSTVLVMAWQEPPMALPFLMAIWKLISIENRNANNGGGALISIENRNACKGGVPLKAD